MARASRKGVAMIALCIGILTFLSAVRDADSRTAQENLDYMATLSNEQGGLIEANDEMFTKYIKSKHSKYSVVAIFNAVHPKHGCEMCQEAAKEFHIAADSYTAVATSSRNIFFVSIEYENAPQAFMKMNLNHAPEIVFFSRKNKKRKDDHYDISRQGMEAAGMLKWLHGKTGLKVPIKKPIPWLKLSVAGIAVVLVCLVAICKPNLLLVVVTNSSLWGSLILFSVLAMTSGQMWNIIRNASNYGRHRTGELRLIIGNDNAQYRYESYLIILLNGGISLGFILLNQASAIGRKVVKKAVGFIGLIMVVAVFGYLISVFRMKSHGYPYYLLFE